jgi:hypothetical protein
MRRSLTLAVLVTALLVSPTLAASSTSTETLTVLPTTTLTGVPASIAYGSGIGGATLTSGSPFTMTATTNSATGLNVTWAASDLTGSGTIAAQNNRYLQMTSPGAGCSSVGALSGYSTAPGKVYSGVANSQQSIVTVASAASCAIAGVTLRVIIPAAATPGAYTGSTTFTATENP